MIKLSALFVFVLLTAGLFAQDEKEDAALAAQNPLANIISMPLQNNTSFGYGDKDLTGNTLNIQPIIPFSLGKGGWVMINRFIIPWPKTIPTYDTDSGTSGSVTGLGNINYTLWIAPPPFGKLTTGFGAVTIWPTATKDELGTDKFSVGPSVVLVYGQEKYMLAAVISQWWSAGGDPDAADVSTFYMQPIFTWFLPKKWYLSSGPIITANWEAEQSQRWTVPLGGGGGKMFNLGKQPLDFQMQAFYYAVKPDAAPDWELRVQLKFIFPKGK